MCTYSRGPATAWVIAVDDHVASVVELARQAAESVTVVAVGWPGPVADGVDRVVSVRAPEDVPLEVLAPVVTKAMTVGESDVVIAGNQPAARSLAGAIAASIDAPLLHDAQSLSLAEADVECYAGASVASVAFNRPIVVVADGGNAVAARGPAEEPEEGESREGMSYGATVIDFEAADEPPVDLRSAKRVVSVGRGLKEKEDLALAQELARALKAELACSRPLAEGRNWLPRDRYVGVSGQKVASQLYMAIGISGQLQHMIGVRGAGTIVAINSDPASPIFQECDYGIVGDLQQVVPALTAAVK